MNKKTVSIEENIIAIRFPQSKETKNNICNLLNLYRYISNDNSYLEYELSELNIKSIYKLKKFGFDFCDTFYSYMSIIDSWDYEEYANKFSFENVKNNGHIKELLDIENDQLKELIIHDRRIKYQYNYSIKQDSNDLLSTLVFRDSPRIWIPSEQYSFTELIDTLHKLKRNKILIVFNTSNSVNSIEEQLFSLSDTLDELNITDDIGIYFRLKNNLSKKFNTHIAEKNYNSMLSNKTKIVGLENNKLPKFLLTNEWKPDAVISLDKSIVSGKIAVYSSMCDMVITYTKSEPIIKRQKI